MCEICLLIEQELRSKGTVAFDSPYGHMRMNMKMSRWSRMLNLIASPIRLIVQFLRDTRPSTHSFLTQAPLIPARVHGFIHTLNSIESKNCIIDTTNPNFTPEKARRYIDIFTKHTRPGARAYRLNDEVLYLDNLNDEQAVHIASELLNLETRAAMEAIHYMGRNA